MSVPKCKCISSEPMGTRVDTHTPGPKQPHVPQTLLSVKAIAAAWTAPLPLQRWLAGTGREGAAGPSKRSLRTQVALGLPSW